MKHQLLATLVLGLSMNAAHASLNPDFKTAKGTVLIAAPTALNGPTNAGVWLINPQTKMFSLDLPALAMNQVYEGWIVDTCTGKKTSTGLFRGAGTDSDAAGAFKGPLALNYPPQPGSDFVSLGSDLTDGAHIVVITIEPYPDMDPNPSGVAILKAAIPSMAAPGTEVVFENIAQ